MKRIQGSVRTAILFCTLPLLFWHPVVPPAAASPERSTDSAYVRTLLDEARRAGLHEDPYWHTLLHYKRGLFRLRSLVDDPAFFLADEGKGDPAAELEATIRSFFTPPLPDRSGEESEKHPVCRFVARYDWLKEKLAFDESKLPVPRCEPFEELIDRIRPESVTLIFPTSHMNSPASMYGHTLLTIETVYESKLLSYAINYAAFTDETFGPFYIVKGLFGLYKGYFSILPYYAKLQEYSDVNDRDIWEYSLDLNEREVRRLMMHIYELENIYSDYYFFNENCSYDLLFLLDAARPGLDLTDRCAWWVIPLDTIREVRKSGLVRNAFYRPSRSTKIRRLASLLSGRRREEALAVARGELEPGRFLEREIPAEEKIAVCDLAGEYLQYRHAKKEMETETYQERFLTTLNARSTLGDNAVGHDSIPAPVRPDMGHHSNRISFGYGVEEDRPFQELRLRPAYHTLIDNGAGYKKGSQIVFLDAVLRYHSQSERFELDALDLIDIVSLAPRDRFFKHTSWKVRTGFFRRRMENGGDYLVYQLNPGFGYAWESGLLGLWYLFFETDFHVGGALDDSYSAGAGGSTGIVRDLTGRWKFHLFARGIRHGLGDRTDIFSAGLGQNFRLSADMSLSLEVRAESDHDDDSRIESTFRWNLFF